MLDNQNVLDERCTELGESIITSTQEATKGVARVFAAQFDSCNEHVRSLEAKMRQIELTNIIPAVHLGSEGGEACSQQVSTVPPAGEMKVIANRIIETTSAAKLESMTISAANLDEDGEKKSIANRPGDTTAVNLEENKRFLLEMMPSILEVITLPYIK